MSSIQQLVEEREDVQAQIDRLEKEERKLYRAIVHIEGMCALCDNWHYPHCGKEQE